jgi:hypothetical protein
MSETGPRSNQMRSRSPRVHVHSEIHQKSSCPRQVLRYLAIPGKLTPLLGVGDAAAAA